jgi:MFS family permease
MQTTRDKLLFWGCFIAVVATAFGFIVRTFVIDQWGHEFGLTQQQRGEILGVGLWPFAPSIILFSLVIDKVGYGRSMLCAFLCQAGSTIVLIFANGYWSLYVGTFILAIGNGIVEAVANPAVATLFPAEKTKWLNILHAGWPAGLVFGGLMALAMGEQTGWQFKIGLVLLPALIYAAILIFCRFPVHERVAAGVPYREMLQEFGIVGALITSSMIIFAVGPVFGLSLSVKLALIAAVTIGFGLYVRALGRPFFIVILLIMIPLATTELGTDSWITPLMEPPMAKLGLQAGWVLVYTSTIMMLLRFNAGPIVRAISPLGLLALGSAVAMSGLLLLSQVSTGLMILLAATVYGLGKSFFWPTMMGLVAEQSPRGGALTMNAVGGVGALSVGLVGTVFLGAVQDHYVTDSLRQSQPALYAQVAIEKDGLFGRYAAIDEKQVATLPRDQQKTVAEIDAMAKKNALSVVAILPAIMLACYLLLIAYFSAKGGYKAQVLTHVELTPEF